MRSVVVVFCVALFASACVNVNTPTPPTSPLVEGVMFSGPITTFTTNGPIPSPSPPTATITWGDGTSSPGVVTFTNDTGDQFEVDGSHTYADEGSFSVRVDVHAPPLQFPDGNATGTFTVQDSSQFTFPSPPSTVTVTEHGPLGVVTTFTDSNLSRVASEFDVQVCLGPFPQANSACAPGTVSGGSGNFTVSSDLRVITDEATANWIWRITLSEHDQPGPIRATANGPIVIIDAPIIGEPHTIAAKPAVAWSGQVASFLDGNVDADTGDFTATIDWGDGTATSAGTMSHNGIPGHFEIDGAHTYATASATPLAVTVKLTDRGGTMITIASSAVVTSTALTVTGTNSVAPQDSAVTLTVANFIIQDLTAALGDFTATIDWGDGSTADAGTITGGFGSFAVAGTHTYKLASAYKTTINVTDGRAGGGMASGTGHVLVDDAFLTVTAPGGITAHEGVAYHLAFSFADADVAATAAKYSIALKWGDGTANSNATVTARASGGFDAKADHTWATMGSYTMEVTIGDANNVVDGGAAAITVFDINVTVLPPDVSGPSPTPKGSSSSGDCSMSPGATTASSSLALLMMMAGALLLARRRHD